jgi:hypothetical protein
MADSPETRSPDGSNTQIGTTEARQGTTGTGTRYVLHISVALAVIVLAIVYFVMMR